MRYIKFCWMSSDGHEQEKFAVQKRWVEEKAKGKGGYTIAIGTRARGGKKSLQAEKRAESR